MIRMVELYRSSHTRLDRVPPQNCRICRLGCWRWGDDDRRCLASRLDAGHVPIVRLLLPLPVQVKAKGRVRWMVVVAICAPTVHTQIQPTAWPTPPVEHAAGLALFLTQIRRIALFASCHTTDCTHSLLGYNPVRGVFDF